MTRLLALMICIVGLCYEAASVQAGPIGYTLRNNILVRFDLASPGTVVTVGAISGAVNSVQSIDFRPSDGLLYGYSAIQNRIVTMNPNNAVTTFVSTPTTASSFGFLGIDFNPVADRLRVVNAQGQNLRIDVSTGATVVDGTLAYAVGDPNFGNSLSVTEVAYTNSDTNPATGTTLYYIDGFGRLLTTSSPNAGTLNTVGALGTSLISSFSGFDIVSDGLGGNTAYAILSSPTFSLHQINLTTGAATNLGVVGDGGIYRGLAIVPPTVPEPSSIMIALGLAAVGFQTSSRRRPAL
jgi:Domain of unknown function (DUF4394)/PEP-CTERM motif